MSSTKDPTKLERALAVTSPSGAGKSRSPGIPDKLPPGYTIDDYEVLSFHAHGGFATVYRARARATGEIVALKVLHTYLAYHPKMVRRFEAEVRTLQRVGHPNIATIHHFGQLGSGRPYFVMEWLEGRTLDEELNERGALSIEETLAFLEDLAGALTAIHESGIVHRDLKSTNVLLVQSGERVVAKLVDFGIAKLIAPDPDEQDDNSLTSTGEMIGTPSYMAPEQILTMPVDERTDIYALGVLIFELLTGRMPFEADTPIELRELHIHAEPPSASSYGPVPASVDAVIQRCLRKRSEERFQSVEELMAALRVAAGVRGVTPHERAAAAGDADTAPAIDAGIHVEIRVECSDEEVDDEVLDELENQLEIAREDSVTAGLDIALSSSSGFLAVVGAARHELSAVEARRRALRTAVQITARLRKARTDDRVRAVLTVHATPPKPQAHGDGQVGGELLHLGKWIAVHSSAAPVATREAIEGLEGEFSVEPLGDGSDRLCVALLGSPGD